MSDDKEPVFRVVRVENGDCAILFEGADGRAIVIDGGGLALDQYRTMAGGMC